MRLVIFTLVLAGAALQAATQRPIVVDDQFRFLDVGDPQLSPDGEWIAYTVTNTNVEADKRNTDIWVVKYDGSVRQQLTHTPTESETSPRWSPDGRLIAFLSSRPGPAKGTQVWVLERSGGEARQLTRLIGGVVSYQWSPDATKLAIVRRDPPAEEPDPKNPKPIVIDKYQFKRDGPTYLTGNARNRIFVYDIDTGAAEGLTTDGDYDESGPEWSPDGRRIAFSSNHDDNRDRTRNTDLFVVDAKPGSKSRRLTDFPGADGGDLAWSPDGAWIAYSRSSDPKFNFHNLNRVAIIPSSGGTPRVLTEPLDRATASYAFTPDGASIVFTVTDDQAQYLARVPAAGGAVVPLTSGRRVVGQPTHARGRIVVTSATSTTPAELHAVENGQLRALSQHNAAVTGELLVVPAEDIAFKSKDGTEIHGLLTRPLHYVPGQRYPTLIRIHGGPTSQDAHTFNFERQIFAANGYAVVNVNYRGSSGRGAKFSEAIFANWGVLEVDDVLAAADHVVALGVADPNRLGIGGWSYGGVLTDYVIASDTRFKGAISGAGSANHISLYGHDQYTFLYDNEFGAPWDNVDLWIRYSYPFFKANRITTPTLFMGGQDDFNVPILGSEQMYQALKTLNVPTQLVIYPGQNHGLTKVAFLRDRTERYLAWYEKYVKRGTQAGSRDQ